MAFKFSAINIVLRSMLIIANSLLLGWFVFFTQYLFTITALAVMLLIQIIFLTKLFNRTDRIINEFIQRLKYEKSEFKNPYLGNKNSSRKLQALLDEIKEHIKKTNFEKESTLFYLQTLFKHIDIGLVSIDNSYRIEMANQAFFDILGIRSVNHLDDIKNSHEEIHSVLTNIVEGNSMIVDLNRNSKTKKFLIKATSLRTGSQILKLISLQSISKEIDKAEAEAWKKLIRVMNHEVRNSIAPITSLSKAISSIYNKLSEAQVRKIEEIDTDIIADSLSGLKTIEKRSEHLLKFIESFKTIDTVSSPVKEIISLPDFLNHIKFVFEQEFKRDNINFYASILTADTKLNADAILLEQAMINILQNASEAFTKDIAKKYIQVEIFSDEKYVNIAISNNGIPIPDEVKQKILIPFFTTKAKGSGIGLSVVQQIMILHGGEIIIDSLQDKTTLTLVFPKNK